MSRNSFYKNRKDDAIPKIVPPRRVPYNILDKFKATLDRMCKLKVIEKCSELK